MAATFIPTRRYGVFGDTCYFTETAITEDNDRIWQVFALRQVGEDYLGDYWYEDSRIRAIRLEETDSNATSQCSDLIDRAFEWAKELGSLDEEQLDALARVLELGERADPTVPMPDEVTALHYLLGDVA